MTVPWIFMGIPTFILWVYLMMKLSDKYGFLAYIGMMFIGAPVLFFSVFIILKLSGINVEIFPGGECVDWTWWGDCKKVIP